MDKCAELQHETTLKYKVWEYWYDALHPSEEEEGEKLSLSDKIYIRRRMVEAWKEYAKLTIELYNEMTKSYEEGLEWWEDHYRKHPNG